ncbi:hypothetical protein [Helicobacter canis]|uniref:hypothetical protein n=1 Tax=Helicobacter canis TaxID=29419 RepID=UPI00155A4C48|nr:hypothetical protein [Helicobacter canis]
MRDTAAAVAWQSTPEPTFVELESIVLWIASPTSSSRNDKSSALSLLESAFDSRDFGLDSRLEFWAILL